MRVAWPAAALLFLCACAVRPAFIPAPQRTFEHYQALPRPSRDLAVGALWIEGHGAYGAGAAADNLETLVGISAVVIDNDLQASLSLGFLQYLDLDPTLHNKITVRLNDVSLVRVKDMAKLEGPAEQPRIYEALRAASATITTTHDIGLDIEARASQQGLPISGRGASGRLSTFTIEAKDVFLAVRIATLRKVSSDPVRIALRTKSAKVKLKGFEVEVSRVAALECSKVQLEVRKGTAIVAKATTSDATPIDLPLAAPIADGEKLYDRVAGSIGRGCKVTLKLTGHALR